MWAARISAGLIIPNPEISVARRRLELSVSTRLLDTPCKSDGVCVPSAANGSFPVVLRRKPDDTSSEAARPHPLNAVPDGVKTAESASILPSEG
jgi:hypothetical protein